MATEAFRDFHITGTPAEIRLAKRTIRRCTFPFEVLVERMERKTGRAHISILFTAPTIGSNFWGQFTSSTATVRIRQGLTDRWTQIMLLHELGHVVDAYQLNASRRHRIHRLWHEAPIEPWWGTKADSDPDRAAYYAQAQEAFGNVFMRLFSDLRYPLPSAGGAPYTHPTPESADERVRALVLKPYPVDEPDPEPEPEPLPDPEPEPEPPPPDPEKAALMAQVEDLQDRIDRMVAIGRKEES